MKLARAALLQCGQWISRFHWCWWLTFSRFTCYYFCFTCLALPGCFELRPFRQYCQRQLNSEKSVLADLPHLSLVSLSLGLQKRWLRTMLKLLRRKSFRKSKEFKPGKGSKSTLNSSSGSVSASNAGGSYYIRPQRRKVSHNTDTSQNSLDRKSIGSHRYSSVNLGSPVPAPEIVQYSRPPENLTSPVRESLDTSGSSQLVKKELNAVSKVSQVMNVISAVRNADETAARLRTGNVMPTPRCLPPTPKRSTGHSQRPSAQALPTPHVHSTAEAVIPKPSARMSLRTKVEIKSFIHISSSFSRW